MADKKKGFNNNNVSAKHENSFDIILEENCEDNEVPSDDDALPQTQPVELLDDQEELSEDLFELSCSEIWGWLQPTPNSKMNPIALYKETYTFGRHNKCDYLFEPKHFQDEKLFNATSKVQFKLQKQKVNENSELVFLSDHSRNGTFVNNQKISPGERVILSNNDQISVVFPYRKVFVFIDNSFIRDWMPRNLRERYNLKDKLGNGAYGEVRMAYDKLMNWDVAIKKIKKRADSEHFVREIQILQKLKHNFIVSMYDYFVSLDYVYIVLEYISGGTLAMRVKESGKLIDEEAKYIFYQLVLALEYLHQEGVAHRDLKPDNVLIAPYKEGDIVKLSDFGLSKLSDGTALRTMCGTPLFTAPEILQTRFMGNYTHQVDIWSLGVTLFYCLSAKHPFSPDRSHMTIHEQIIRGSYSMNPTEWKRVNPQSISLTRKMLVVDSTKRISIPEILQHPWLQDESMKARLKKVLQSGERGPVDPSSPRRAQTVEKGPGDPSSPKRARLRSPEKTLRKS